MQKIKTIIESPVGLRSGYSDWSLSLIKCFLKNPRLDIRLAQTTWGLNAPAGTFNEPDIEKLIIKEKEVSQPDALISITLPHLSQVAGKRFNCNISAGVEVDMAPDYIIEGINRYDLNIALSNYTKATYLNSKIKPIKPIEVLGWSQDYVAPVVSKNIDEEMNMIQEEEVFLFVGQMTTNDTFGDRKNMGNLIKCFTEAFVGRTKKPALLLKTNGTNFSNFDRNMVLEKIQYIQKLTRLTDIPNIYVLYGELNKSEMNYLFHHPKVIGHVSMTRGEGWGMPLFLGSMTGKPVICSNNSGLLDFMLDKDNKPLFIPIEGELKTVPANCISEFFMKDSKWFECNHNDFRSKIISFYQNDRTKYIEQAKELAKINKERYNMDKMAYRLNKIIDKYLK